MKDTVIHVHVCMCMYMYNKIYAVGRILIMYCTSMFSRDGSDFKMSLKLVSVSG